MEIQEIMKTSYATSPDGTRIAYDVTGEGPTVLLLHGGGHTRQRWHDAGLAAANMGEFAKFLTGFQSLPGESA